MNGATGMNEMVGHAARASGRAQREPPRYFLLLPSEADGPEFRSEQFCLLVRELD
jgi:hypothetical protein